MGSTPSFNDPFGRTPGPEAGPYALAPDRFKERAGRDAARRAAQPRDAFAGTGRVKDAFAPKSKAEVRAAAMKPAKAPKAEKPQKEPKAQNESKAQRTLANGAALQMVASQPEIVPVQRIEKDEVRIRRAKPAARASSLVLVSSSSVVTASATPAVQTGGPGDLAMPKVDQPKPKPAARLGGGGGAGQPPRDRIFNQDDMVGVAIVIAMLLLLALYLFRGGGPQSAPIDNRIVSTQFAAATPPAPPQPLADPFGDKPVDLTPKSPLPPEVAATPAPPPPAADITMHAWFCTAKWELTPQTMAALDKQVASWKSELATKQLIVAGYADTRGSNDYNITLSSARATAVADYLKSKGVNVASASGAGELNGLADNENCSNQRRVDVRLSDGKDAPPDRSCAPPKEDEKLACA